MDQYWARLRSLASTCDFQDPDSDILAQLIQGCASPPTRRKAPREDSTLKQILDDARAGEVAEDRAAEMESPSVMPYKEIQRTRRDHKEDKPDSPDTVSDTQRKPNNVITVDTHPTMHAALREDRNVSVIISPEYAGQRLNKRLFSIPHNQ